MKNCKFLHFGADNSEIYYAMNYGAKQVYIDNCYCEFDLGVIFHSNILFDNHIYKAVKKVNLTLGVVEGTFAFLDNSVLISLYEDFVWPHLEYGNVIWHPCLKRHSAAVEKV